VIDFSRRYGFSRPGKISVVHPELMIGRFRYPAIRRESHNRSITQSPNSSVIDSQASAHPELMIGRFSDWAIRRESANRSVTPIANSSVIDFSRRPGHDPVFILN
jgi:hypothetical protein